MFVKETFLICDGNIDGQNHNLHGENYNSCECNFNVDCRADGDSAQKLRLDSKGEGWKRIKGGDYCPACAKRLEDKE